MSASIQELETLYQHIIRATHPWDIFGKLDHLSIDETRERVKQIYYQLVRVVHADLYVGDPRAHYMASEAMRELITHYKAATRQIDDGIYHTGSNPPATASIRSEFVVEDRRYQIFGDAVEGDFCQVFTGEVVSERGARELVVLKTPLDAHDNDLMINEASVLQSVTHKSLPVFLDSFRLSDGRMVNVLRRISGGYDLVEVRQRFPQGLPAEHIVWVLDRLLSVLGFLHINNVIHGAIEPGNLMIVPENHNGLILDFLLATPNATIPGAKYKGGNRFSAPEIIRNPQTRPHPTADMYALGLCMLDLLGGDVETGSFPPGTDSRIVRFIQEFLVLDPSQRADDAWKTWQKLKALRKEVFGASSQFLPLHIPTR